MLKKYALFEIFNVSISLRSLAAASREAMKAFASTIRQFESSDKEPHSPASRAALTASTPLESSNSKNALGLSNMIASKYPVIKFEMVNDPGKVPPQWKPELANTYALGMGADQWERQKRSNDAAQLLER